MTDLQNSFELSNPLHTHDDDFIEDSYHFQPHYLEEEEKQSRLYDIEPVPNCDSELLIKEVYEKIKTISGTFAESHSCNKEAVNSTTIQNDEFSIMVKRPKMLKKRKRSSSVSSSYPFIKLSSSFDGKQFAVEKLLGKRIQKSAYDKKYPYIVGKFCFNIPIFENPDQSDVDDKKKLLLHISHQNIFAKMSLKKKNRLLKKLFLYKSKQLFDNLINNNALDIYEDVKN